jgi:hypothetical protein
LTIGLCGSHRTGKSSLARSFSKKSGLKFVETSASAVFKEMGLDPALTYGFETRLSVQERIIEVFEETYAKHSAKSLCITDRTPLDLMAYTLAEAVGDSVQPHMQDRLSKYIDRCIEVTNRRFCALVVVQPGIPLVVEDGKAALNNAYIEHLNSIILGLSVDERIEVPHFYLPRHMVDMKERISAVDFVVGRVTKRSMDQIASGEYPIH